MKEIIEDIQEYLNRQADADWDYDANRFIPNDAMKLISRVEELKNKYFLIVYDNCRRFFDVECPFDINADEATKEAFREDIVKVYKDFCEGRCTAFYSNEQP